MFIPTMKLGLRLERGLKDYEEKHKDGVIKVSKVATPPTPTEKAEKLHSKVRAAYMKKLLPGLNKK